MKTTTYTRKNDNKEYTILEVNEDLNQITLRDTNTEVMLRMVEDCFKAGARWTIREIKKSQKE
jgi:hypothetical protein